MLEGILKDSDIYFAAVDLECKLIGFTNATFQRFLSYFQYELRVGGCFLEALRHAGLGDLEECWRRALAGESFTRQGSFSSQNTNEVFQSSYFPLWNEIGHIVGAATISCRDTTHFLEEQIKERTSNLTSACKKLEQEAQEILLMQNALQESELMYRTLCDATNAIVWRCSEDGKFILPNQSWENFTGQSTQDSLGVGWLDCIHPDDRERVSKLWKNVSSSSTLRYYTRVWSVKEKDYRNMLVCASLLEGNLTKVESNVSLLLTLKECVAAGVDIHELKETKKKLKKLTNRYHLALDAAGIGTWEWDIERGLFFADKRDWSLIGVTSGMPQAFTLRQFTECIHPDDRDDIQRKLMHCSNTGAAYNAEFRIIWPDNSTHWLVGRAQRFFCKEGHPYVVGVMWDVTQNKMLEEQRLRSLKQEEEMKAAKQAEEYERRRAAEAEDHRHRQEEFIDTVCHEIRNPLVGIYGGMNLLKDKLRDIQTLLSDTGDTNLTKLFEEANEHLNTIGQCAEQQKVLVDDVLDLSRLESARVDLDIAPFCLQKCIEVVIQMFKAKMMEKGLELKKIMPKELVYLKGDVHRIRQVIINLLSNAVKFTNSGYVEIKAAVEETSINEVTLCVSVKDSGIGISSELLPTIFDRFTQAKKSGSQYGGSGLGLAISRRLVEAMGGKIFVTSDAGEGATFFFTVKCGHVSAAEIANMHPAEIACEVSKPTKSKRILVVDDNVMNRKVLSSYLEKGGHVYDVASNGAEAVDKCGQNKYDMIFMDIEMPIMNGLEATTILKSKKVGCPIVGLSGNARKEKIEVAFQAGMDEYLTKPYHKSDIERIVNSFGEENSSSPSVRRAKKMRKE